MLHVDWNRKLPTKKDIKDLWKEIQFTRISIENKEIHDFIELFKDNFSGHIAFECFRVSENEIFDWYASRNRIEETNFFENFLSLPIVFESFVFEGTHENIKYNDFILGNFDFEWGKSLTLDGELASNLLHSGVYKRFNGSSAEARKHCQKFCNDLFGERYEEISVYYSYKAWNSWFYDFIVDITYLIIDKRYRKIYLLCLSDVD